MASKAFISATTTLGLCESLGLGLYNSIHGRDPGAMSLRARCNDLVSRARAARHAYHTQQHTQVRSLKTARRIQMSFSALQQQCRASGGNPSSWICFTLARTIALRDVIKNSDRKAAVNDVCDALQDLDRMIAGYIAPVTDAADKEARTG